MLKTWRHRLSNKNIELRTANCAFCGEVRIVCTNSGKQITWRCARGRKMGSRSKKGHLNQHYRKTFLEKQIGQCAKCEIEKSDISFFDVNHKDGDHDNNEIKNLELLCPNCHRIESLTQWKENRMEKWNKSMNALVN